MLILPVIIVATREALRAIPDSIREGGYALGATKWEVIWSHLLPMALPGALTGIILALSRAIGEAAPILVVGVSLYQTYATTGPFDGYMALPTQIYDWISRPQQVFQDSAAAGIVVAMVVLLAGELVRDLASEQVPAALVVTVYQRKGVSLVETEKAREERRLSGVSRDQREVRQRGDGAPTGEGSTLGMKVEDLSAFYGSFKAVTDVSMDIQANKVTALIGPSGCGKSTFIRCLNRMHEVIPGAHAEGRVMLGEQDIYAKSADPVIIRRRVGMVFQKPNPFSKSIYENVVVGRQDQRLQGRSWTSWSRAH